MISAPPLHDSIGIFSPAERSQFRLSHAVYLPPFAVSPVLFPASLILPHRDPLLPFRSLSRPETEILNPEFESLVIHILSNP